MPDSIDALVIFGATGDLAKLETFPALVGLVERGVLDVPVIGVAKSGWGLAQFRDYATASLKLNGMDPDSPAATRMLGLLRPAGHRRGRLEGRRPGARGRRPCPPLRQGQLGARRGGQAAARPGRLV
jgi:Glucose-6-phosphate dehydrogenase, NAD binding domain